MPRLGLALSGGGLRATLFHLGVVRFLRDAALLDDVTHIVAVSGGSILGAHLALNWDRYRGSEAEFEASSSTILDFVRSDARNHIVRRIPFLTPVRWLQQIAGRGASRRFTSTGLLEKLYASQLYGDARVYQLPETPELHILTTNVSEGGLCSFTRAGLILQHRANRGGGVEALPARLTRVALAVAASSAFPGFFPPPMITAEDLGLAPGEFAPQAFTDGGVYDNLGVRAFDILEAIDPPLDQILVSDVGKTFVIVQPKPMGMITRALRATDILWDRVGQLEKQNFQSDPRFLFVEAQDQVDLKEDPTALHPVIQPEVANIRTDLDRFSPLEITALVQHGYGVARKQCYTRPDLFGAKLPSTPPWDPLAGERSALAAPNLSPHDAPTAQYLSLSATTQRATEQAEQLRKSSTRRIWSTLLDLRDWPTLVYLPLLFLLLVVLPWQAWRERRQADTNATIIEAITQGSPDFRKILEIVQRDSTPSWKPQPVEDAPALTPKQDDLGFELVSDTNIIDVRDWRPKTRDLAHYYRRIRVRKLADADRLVIPFPRTFFDRAEFHGSPDRLKPVVRRVVEGPKKDRITWECQFDLAEEPVGGVTDIEIEATFYDLESHRGPNQNLARYTPLGVTGEASFWVLFPESRPYQDYRLVRYPETDPTTFQKIETRYTIDHPRGSIIAWSIINPEPGYVYECSWDLR